MGIYHCEDWFVVVHGDWAEQRDLRDHHDFWTGRTPRAEADPALVVAPQPDPAPRFPWWWRWFTRPGYRHCFCLRFDGNVWLAVDSLAWGTDIRCATDPQTGRPLDERANLLAFYASIDHCQVYRLGRPTERGRYARRGVLTCVTLAKQLGGIRAPWVWTPYQLARYLEGQGHGWRFRTAAKPVRAGSSS